MQSNSLNSFLGNRRKWIFLFVLIFGIVFLSAILSKREDESFASNNNKDREGTNKQEIPSERTPTRNTHNENDDLSASEVYERTKDSIVFISVRRAGNDDEPDAIGATGK